MKTLFGKTRQFRKTLVQHWDEMYRVCFSWCHDPQLSADLVQTSIEAALHNHQRFDSADYLKKWLFTVLVNNWRDHCRRYRQHTDLEDLELSHDQTPESDNMHAEKIRHIYQSMGNLSLEQREVLSLVALEGFSYNQTAEILNIPAGTVMSRLCRARKSLRAMIHAGDERSTSEKTIRRIK